MPGRPAAPGVAALEPGHFGLGRAARGGHRLSPLPLLCALLRPPPLCFTYSEFEHASGAASSVLSVLCFAGRRPLSPGLKTAFLPAPEGATEVPCVPPGPGSEGPGARRLAARDGPNPLVALSLPTNAHARQWGLVPETWIALVFAANSAAT